MLHVTEKMTLNKAKWKKTIPIAVPKNLGFVVVVPLLMILVPSLYECPSSISE